MSVPAVLLSCVARAAVKHLGNFLTFGLAGDILVDAWDAYQKLANTEPQRCREVEALALASPAEARQAAKDAIASVAGHLAPEDRQRLEDLLSQAPAAIRRSLRGPADPSGKSMSPARRLAGAKDLYAVMPLAPVRFKAGDRPAGVGDWQLVELLGVGGYGEVWKARNHHVPTMTPVVLKFCLDAEARQQLLAHEARIIGRVQAQGRLPGIVPLLHSYLGADPPCLEFEFVEGGELTGLIREWHAAGKASVPFVTRLVAELARTIGRAHRLNPPVVHRDLKPSNILVQRQPDGSLSYRIADFGIGGLAARQAVRQTITMDGSYTPLYASPQQMAGQTADPRDDVYSLGVLWFQMLTGDLERGAPTGESWKRRLRKRGLSSKLERLLQRAFEHNRDDRPVDGEELAVRIERAMVPERTTTRRAMLALAIGCPLGIGVCAGGLWWMTAENSDPKGEAPAGRSRAKEPTRVVAAPKEPPPPPVSPEPKDWPAGLAKPLVNSIGMRFARIPAGKFMRGSPDSDKAGFFSERPCREIEITKAFHLGIYEVTQAEYRRVMGESPSKFAGDFLPVEQVPHGDAAKFCRKLSAMEEEMKARRVYRLPTEAEWEYACRAGARTHRAYHFGDALTPERANYSASKLAKTTDVGGYPPNAFGLYDMHGNVWEWCADWFDDNYYEKSDVKDPRGPLSGTTRVLRGGSWGDIPRHCRTASRRQAAPSAPFSSSGFRVCLISTN